MVWCDFTQLSLRIIRSSLHFIRSDLHLLRHRLSWTAQFLFFNRDYVCLSCPEMLEFQGVHAWIRDTSVIFWGFCLPAIRLHDVRCVATQCTVLVHCHILGLDFRMQCDVACSVMCHLVQCLSGSLPLQFLCRPWVRPIVPNLLASSSVL